MKLAGSQVPDIYRYSGSDPRNFAIFDDYRCAPGSGYIVSAPVFENTYFMFFFRFQKKNMTYYVFLEMTYQKVVKSLAKV